MRAEDTHMETDDLTVLPALEAIGVSLDLDWPADRAGIDRVTVLVDKTPKRRVKAKLRDDRAEAVGPNDVWAMHCPTGDCASKKLRVLTVVDTFSRYVPVLDIRISYRGEDVVTTLDRVCGKTGYPKTIRVDQGSEFISRDMDLWAYQRGVTLDFSRPGKQTDNAFIEAFNGRFRAECLNAHWFLTLADAVEKLETRRRYYNEERPHSAIGNKAPITLTKSGGHHQPVTLIEAGKLSPTPAEGSGSDQVGADSTLR